MLWEILYIHIYSVYIICILIVCWVKERFNILWGSIDDDSNDMIQVSIEYSYRYISIDEQIYIYIYILKCYWCRCWCINEKPTSRPYTLFILLLCHRVCMAYIIAMAQYLFECRRDAEFIYYIHWRYEARELWSLNEERLQCCSGWQHKKTRNERNEWRKKAGAATAE